MSFQISPELDAKKVFLVRSSELEGRLDPNFYRSYLIKNFKKALFEKLGNIARFSNEIWDQKSFFEKSFPYIEIGEIELSTGELNKINNIDISNAPSRARMIVRNDDILISTTRPGRGAISLLKTDNICIASTGFSVIRSVIHGIDKRYIFFCLRLQLSLQQMEQRSSGGNYPAITQEELRKILIPVPPLKLQSAIVAKMDAAYSSKREKEAEAQRLLDSIDDYLLGELGIELPEQEENTVQSRIFTRRFSEISGGRFDAPVHHKTYFLYSSKFSMEKLKDYVFINPTTSFLGIAPDMEVSFIPMEKVSDQYGEAEISDCRFFEQSGGYTKFQDNDLLWAKITPCMQNGKSAVVTGLRNGFGFGSTEFHVFRAKSNIDIRYIHALFRLISLRKHAVLYFSGSAGHQRVSDDFFKKMSIPLPPLEKQTEIADHITLIRSRAKQLQQEAKEGLEQAKREVEAVLLGDA